MMKVTLFVIFLALNFLSLSAEAEANKNVDVLFNLEIGDAKTKKTVLKDNEQQIKEIISKNTLNEPLLTEQWKLYLSLRSFEGKALVQEIVETARKVLSVNFRDLGQINKIDLFIVYRAKWHPKDRGRTALIWEIKSSLGQNFAGIEPISIERDAPYKDIKEMALSELETLVDTYTELMCGKLIKAYLSQPKTQIPPVCWNSKKTT